MDKTIFSDEANFHLVDCDHFVVGNPRMIIKKKSISNISLFGVHNDLEKSLKFFSFKMRQVSY